MKISLLVIWFIGFTVCLKTFMTLAMFVYPLYPFNGYKLTPQRVPDCHMKCWSGPLQWYPGNAACVVFCSEASHLGCHFICWQISAFPLADLGNAPGKATQQRSKVVQNLPEQFQINILPITAEMESKLLIQIYNPSPFCLCS